MSRNRTYLAIDLGAESGRAIVGRLRQDVLEIQEVYRFPNEPVRLGDTLYWDVPRLFREILEGIRRAGRASEGRLDGIAVDSWGVDFGLLDASGDLFGNPVHYRDARTQGMLDEILAVIPRRDLFEITGIQFMELNTLVQLAALKKRTQELIYAADKLLMFADLMSYFLCGRMVGERTLASTSQMLDARSGEWSHEVVAPLGIPPKLLPELVDAGTALAPLHDHIVRDCGLAEAPQVIACASHDTASAVAAAPAGDGDDWAYISSGTWSLVGMELDEPRITQDALGENFTNEAGVYGTVRFLKNVNGLWLIQECRREWAREGKEYDYDQLGELAAAAPPSRSWIDPNDPEFHRAGDMPRRIQESCRRSGQWVPQTRGDILRCALESLARTYREVVVSSEAITGRTVERLHLLGGGSQQLLLNQLTANVLGIPVIAGPVEATAMGNILMQAKATGDVKSLEELRSIVRASAELKTFRPRERRSPPRR